MRRAFIVVLFLFVSGACGKDASGPDVAAPVLIALSPVQGTVGTEVRIEGVGCTDRITVRFDDLESPRVIRQGGALFALAPAGLVAARQYAVHVLNDGAPADTTRLSFTAVAPQIDRANGVTMLTGLRGKTLILEGAAISDSVGLSNARVYFSSPGGVKLAAVIADTSDDWSQGIARRSTWRAPVGADGSIGAWQAMAELPAAASHSALVSFGPFLYAVGGGTLATTPTGASQSGSETSNAFLARVDLRSRNLTATGWSATASMGKARSKHGAIFAGGSVLVTSGVDAGNPGSARMRTLPSAVMARSAPGTAPRARRPLMSSSGCRSTIRPWSRSSMRRASGLSSFWAERTARPRVGLRPESFVTEAPAIDVRNRS